MTMTKDDPRIDSADVILRALAADNELRVVAVGASQTCRDIANRHRVRGAQAVALSRSVSAGLLLATLTKGDRETVTLQILTENAVGAATVDAASSGRVRAHLRRGSLYIAIPAGTRARLAPLVGTEGVVNVVREVGLREHFSASTPLVSGEIDRDIEHHLVASEQIDSVLVCDASIDADGHVQHAAGLLVQAMPGSGQAQYLASLRTRLHAGALFSLLSESTSEAPARSDALPLESLTRAALPELADIKVLERRAVYFGCPCSRARAESTLALLGRQELTEIIVDPGTAEVVCEFCQTRYHFTTEDLAQTRARLPSPQLPS